MNNQLVHVGTYTEIGSRKSEGIYLYGLDLATGALTHRSTMKGVANPSFLALSPGNKFLVCVSKSLAAKGAGMVRSFSVAVDGRLTAINTESSGGYGPCHVSIEQTGRFALVANYASGSIAMLPLGPDGRLGPASAFMQHKGSGPDPNRQAGPHAHCIITDPTNRYALAADLGLDRVIVYRMDLEKGGLIPHSEGIAEPGAGPRHLEFHPNGRFLYVINELNSTMTLFGWDPTSGRLQSRQTVRTIPDGFPGENSCADVHFEPRARFLYGSNRGHDSIVRYQVNASTGEMSDPIWQSTLGKTPRNFAISPDGAFLLAANQDSDSVVTFRLDPRTGALSETGQIAGIPTPVCLKFA